MLLVQLRLIPLYRRAPFGPGSWAFSFPIAAAVTCGVYWLDAEQVRGGTALGVRSRRRPHRRIRTAHFADGHRPEKWHVLAPGCGGRPSQCGSSEIRLVRGMTGMALPSWIIGAESAQGGPFCPDVTPLWCSHPSLVTTLFDAAPGASEPEFAAEGNCCASHHRTGPFRRRWRAHAVRHPHPHAAENDVVVRVHAAGFTPGELGWSATWTDRGGRDRTASVPGHELSGVVLSPSWATAPPA